MIKICEYCHNEFKTRDKRQKYCNRKCYQNNKISKQNIKIKVSCLNCGREFEKYPSQILKRNFCSKQCSLGYNSVTCKCDNCGKNIKIANNQYILSKHHYCSNECRYIGFSKYYSGENNTNYSSDNYSILNCMYCNKEYKVLSCTVGRRKNNFCSKDCKNKWQSENIRGINHPNYNPNKTEQERLIRRSYTDYWDWRKAVYERDNYTCQCCGDNKGHNLVAHHCFNYAEYEDLRTDINNGITLCDNCHKEFHKQYGNKQNTKQQLIEYINNKKTS